MITLGEDKYPGRGDSSVDTMLAVQVAGSEFDYPELMYNLGIPC